MKVRLVYGDPLSRLFGISLDNYTEVHGELDAELYAEDVVLLRVGFWFFNIEIEKGST